MAQDVGLAADVKPHVGKRVTLAASWDAMLLIDE
jgi:hypothetical protein